MKLARYGLNWDGEIALSVNGGFYDADEVDALLERLGTVPAAPPPRVVVRVPDDMRSRRFGYANGREAKRYLRGDIEECVVRRKKSETHNMPTYFGDGPGRFDKPLVGLVVMVDGEACKTIMHTRTGIMVETPAGTRKNTAAWEYIRANKDCNSKGRADRIAAQLKGVADGLESEIQSPDR